MRRLLLTALALALLGSAVLATASGAFPGRNGKLVYGWSTLDEPELGPFRYSDGIRGARLGLLDADGGGLRLLPATGTDPADPVFSPSGTRLAFSTLAGGVRELWTSDVYGRGARRLLPGTAGAPSWSPQGTIAFVRGGVVTIMDAGGSGLRTLRALRDVTRVRWSPDGRKLVVEQFDAGISIANSDGSGIRMIVQDAVGATYNYATAGVDWQPLR